LAVIFSPVLRILKEPTRLLLMSFSERALASKGERREFKYSLDFVKFKDIVE
jgi:hypothetical protein